jgi:hypothetical protein
MSLQSRYIYALSFAIAAIGFLLPLWPLCVLGILLAALSGRYAFAVGMALLLDLGSGIPTGLLHYLFVPYTILAACACALRLFGGAYFLDKTPPDTL